MAKHTYRSEDFTSEMSLKENENKNEKLVCSVLLSAGNQNI